MPTNYPATVSATPNFSFYTSKSQKDDDPFGFQIGGIRPIDADYNGIHSEASWSFPASGILQGEKSLVFGYVSDSHPKTVYADLAKINDSATLKGKPLVFAAASLEPALALLLGIGLLSAGMLRRRKK